VVDFRGGGFSLFFFGKIWVANLGHKQ